MSENNSQKKIKSVLNETLCKYCHNKINYKSKVCCHCGRDQRFFYQYFASSTAFIMALIAISQAFMGWLQFDESKKKRIEAEEVLFRAEAKAKQVFSITSTNSYNSTVKANTVLSITQNDAKRAIDKTQHVLKLAKNNANITKIVTDAAKKDMAQSVISVDKLLNESNIKIAKMESDFDNINKSIQVVKVETSTELGKLKNRNELLALSDNAISKGDRNAFNKLEELTANNKNDLAARAEMLKVKAFYKENNRIPEFELKLTKEGISYVNDKVPTGILINILHNHPDWGYRGRAAQLLSKRKEKIVPDALIQAITNDIELDVVNNAIWAFTSVTGYKDISFLNHLPLIEWWQKNKSEVEKSLK